MRGEQPSRPASSLLLLCVPRQWDLLVGSHCWLKVFIPFPFFVWFWVCPWVPLVSTLGEQQGRGCAGRELAVPTFSTCPQFLELWMSQRLWGGQGSRSVWEQCLWVGGVYVPVQPGINQPGLVLTQTTSRAGTKMDLAC